MQIFLVSDTHFGHANILTFRGLNGQRIRPEFTDVEEMDETMVENWNAVVRPCDLVYHLGDVVMHKHSLAIVKRLNGHKRLVLGNHDGFVVKAYQQAGFQKIFGSRKLDNLLLTHIPVHPLSIPQWALGNVHGHIHERDSFGPRYLNVSVERTNYAPIPIEVAKQLLRIQQENAHAVRQNSNHSGVS